MKIVLAVLAVVGFAMARPQFELIRIAAPDFNQHTQQDGSGQLSGSFTTRDISRTDQLRLVPNGSGDYVPEQISRIVYTAPNGEVVDTNIQAGPLGSVITGSHVPRV